MTLIITNTKSTPPPSFKLQGSRMFASRMRHRDFLSQVRRPIPSKSMYKWHWFHCICLSMLCLSAHFYLCYLSQSIIPICIFVSLYIIYMTYLTVHYIMLWYILDWTCKYVPGKWVGTLQQRMHFIYIAPPSPLHVCHPTIAKTTDSILLQPCSTWISEQQYNLSWQQWQSNIVVWKMKCICAGDIVHWNGYILQTDAWEESHRELSMT